MHHAARGERPAPHVLLLRRPGQGLGQNTHQERQQHEGHLAEQQLPQQDAVLALAASSSATGYTRPG